jgi:Glucodextranase, domain B
VTYNGSTFTLAVTYPNQDITTSRSYIILTGKISGATSRVRVTVTMNGKTYRPVVDDGVFRQRLVFTKAKLYAITVKATDQAGDTSTVTRNVIYTRGNTRIERDD